MQMFTAEEARGFVVTTTSLAEQLREWAKQRGIDLNTMTDEEWEALVDDILHSTSEDVSEGRV